MASTPIAVGTTNTTPGSIQVGQTDRLGKPWEISNKGIAFLGVQESGVINGVNFQGHRVTDGLILQVYVDSRGLPTVGCGHLVLPEDNLRAGDVITLEHARTLARKDIATAEKAVHRHMHVPLFQHEYDALVSLVFNCGQGFAGEITRLVNTGNYDDVPEFIIGFRAGHGNARRRRQEAAMFKEGNYDANH